MESLLIYLLKSGICLFVFYALYQVFLKKSNAFGIIRAYLLFVLIVSTVLPAISIDFSTNPMLSGVFVLDTAVITNKVTDVKLNNELSLMNVALLLYLIGFVIFLGKTAYQLYRIILLLVRNPKENYKGYRIVKSDKDYNPFSFLNYIVINKTELQKSNSDKIVLHEYIHARQKHTYDLLLIELLCTLHWFNPVIWFYKQSLSNLHEFLADEGVLQSGFNKIEYQDLLLGQTLGINPGGLYNNFNQSILKRRFLMMSKSKNKQTGRISLTFLLAIVFTFGLTFMFNNQGFSQETNKSKPAKEKSAEADEAVFETVEQVPEYTGGQDALINFLVKNVEYPKVAIESGIQGTVYVSFVVEKDGSVTDVKVKRGVSAELDAEAVRVISLMPNWNPGMNGGKTVRVRFVLPVAFRLDSKSDEK
jgi:TonB family protein